MTNVSPIAPQADVRAEARDWVIRFNRDAAPSKADIAALNAWANQSPAHKAELHSAQQVWLEGDQLAELAVPVKAPTARFFARGLRQLKQLLMPNGTRGFVTAMSLSAILIGATWYMNTPVISGNGSYQTAIGEQRTLILKDQSRIQMDTNSKVRIAYSEGIREIYLEQGKAHFDVAKNPDRPFDVYAAGGLVRAVGTAFSVFINNAAVRVTVDEGRVNLARVENSQENLIAPFSTAHTSSSPSSSAPSSTGRSQSTDIPNKVFLSVDKGQSALFDQHQQALTQLADNELSQELAWRRGLLIFIGEPLDQVVNEVSRYTATKIEISDPELGKLLIGGRFRTGELEALLDVLEAGFGVQVSYVDRNHIQLRAGTN
ncbi:FecR domain-containing protein [Porticoccaceae bacterium]|nr:FecR domain-containing protein [Porticoccaceae bacterium]